jgi:hypothetical protein
VVKQKTHSFKGTESTYMPVTLMRRECGWIVPFLKCGLATTFCQGYMSIWD